MSDNQLNVDFKFNTEETKQQAAEVRKDVKSVNEAATAGNKPLKDREGILERLRRRMTEIKSLAEKTTSFKFIEKANAEVEYFQKEIDRLTKIGREGFDDMGKAIPDFAIPAGKVERLTYEANLYKKAIKEATNTDIIAKYNVKLQDTKDELSRLSSIGKSGFDAMGNAIVKAIEKPIGTIERLKAAMKGYSNMVATSTNPDIISKYNQKLQQTQLEVTRLSNVGKTGFDELGNKILIAEKNTRTFVGGLSAGIERLRRLAYMIPGLGLTGLISLAIVPLFKWIKTLGQATEAQKTFNSVAQESSKNIAKEVAQTELLIDKINNKNTSEKERQSLLDDFVAKNPAVLGALNLQNIATLEGKGILDSYIETLKEKIRLQSLEQGYINSVQRAADLRSGALADETDFKWYNTLARSLGDMFTFRRDMHGTFKDIENINKQRREDAAKTEDAISESLLKGIKSEVENAKQIKEVKDTSLNALEVQLSKINERLRKAQAGEDTKTLKADKVALEAQIKQRIKLLGLETGKKTTGTGSDKLIRSTQALEQKVYDIRAEYNRKSLTKDEEELQAVRDKFVKIAEEVERFNKNPKNKIKVSTAGLMEVRDQAISDLTYKHETERLKISLIEQKKLYEDYEAYKLSLGKERADERYRDFINTEKTYLENLRTELAKIPEDGSGAHADRKEDLERRIREEETLELKKFDELLKANQSYQAEVKLAIETFEAEKKRLVEAGEFEAVEVLENGHKLKLNSLADSNAKQLDSYKQLFEGVENVSKKQAEVVLVNAKKMFEQLKAEGLISEELYKQILKRIHETEKAIGDRLPEKLLQLSYAFNDIQQSVSGINQSFGDMIGMASKALQTYSNVLKLSDAYKNAQTDQEKFAAGAELVSTAVSGIASIIGTITSASKARKDAEEAYYNSVIKGQREYNLSLIEGIRLRHELNENVFVKDYKERALDSSKALVKANEDYLKSLEDLEKGKAKVGQRNALDWNAIGKTTASGAGAGAAIGTMILPGIGTIVGGAIGTVVGFIGGLFGGKKKKDTYGGLLSEYPELIKKNKDGIEEFNTALAESLIANNLVDESTKALLKNTIDLNNERVKAIEQLKGVISELAGSLGNDLQNSLVSAFKAGEDSADAFGKSVSKVIENIIAQMLFAELFKKDFDKLQKEMEQSYGIGGDQSFVDDLIRFYESAGKKVGSFNEALEAAAKLGKEHGLDVFGKDEKNAKAMTGIQRELTTEKTASEFTGLTRASYDLNKKQFAITEKMLELGKRRLDSLLNMLRDTALIQENTKNTVIELKSAITELKQINKNTSSGSSAYDRGN